MWLSWIFWVGLKSSDKYPFKSQKKRMSCKESQRLEWCGQKPKKPRNVDSNWELEEEDSLLEFPEGVQRLQHFDLHSPAFRTVKEYISVILSHPGCDHASQQPQETNIHCYSESSAELILC